MADLSKPGAELSLSDVVIQHIEPLSQLPGVQVDYARIVDLTAKQQYEDLRQLFHRLKLGGKGVTEEDRARHVIQYAIEARTAFIKLLALLKWKNQADVDQVLPTGEQQGRVSLAPGLDQWQDQQNAHNREVRNQLEVWAEDLKRFQLQPPDIATAVDLLVDGRFQRGPRYLDDTYIPSEPLTADGRTRTLKAMDELISYRLRVEEQVPTSLKVTAIRDGKLYLRADRLFECTLTLGTIDPRRQWLLTDFRFLYIAKQSVKGKNAHPAHIPDEVKAMLCQTVDNVLGGMYEARVQAETQLAPSVLLPRQKTLYKLYEILQLLSLSHQLETLYRQAKQLEASEWAGNLRVRMAGDRKSFVMTYWSKPGPNAALPPVRQSSTSAPPHGGDIIIRIVPTASQDDEILYGPASEAESTGHALEVNWHPEASWLGISPGTRPIVDDEIFEVDSDDLDVEPILLDIVTYHAEQLTEGLKTFMDERLGSASIFHKDDIAVASSELGSNVVLRVYDNRWLKLQINTVTGKLHIGEADATIASGVEARLATSSRLANIHTDKLLDVLINTRTMLARDALEEKLRCLEVQPLRDLGVSIQELDAHNLASTGPGQPMKPILHAALPADPDKSVLLAMHANSLTIAIVHFGYRTTVPLPAGGMIATEKRSILDMEWLDVADLPVSQTSSRTARPKTIMMYDRIARTQIQALTFELSLDDLQRVFAFCNAVVTTRSIHTQFTAAGLPPIAENEAVPLNVLATGLAPQRNTKRRLAIASKAIFTDPQVCSMISNTVHISVERGPGNTIGVGKIIARLALRPKSLSIAAFAGQASQEQVFVENTSGWTVRLDTRVSSPSFTAETTRSQDYVAGLTEELSRISMLLRLLAETEQVVSSEDGANYRIQRYDLTGVSVAYWASQAISLLTPSDTSTAYQIRDIELDLDTRTKLSVTTLFQTILSAELRDGLGLLGFFQYARLVAPILEALADLTRSSGTSEGRAEFAVCTKRHWMILWDKGTDQRYGLSINLIFSGECQDWSGGYLVSDASASIARDGSNLVDVIPTLKWKSIIKKCNGEERVGVELEKNGDLVVRAGRGEVKMFKRLVGELDALSR